MARTSISSLLLGLALAGCTPSAPPADAGPADSTVTHDAPPHVVAAGSPAYPYTINGLDAGIAPHLFLGQCDAGLVWANGGPGSDGGCVSAGGGSGGFDGSAGALTNANPAGQFQDINSLIWGDPSSEDIFLTSSSGQGCIDGGNLDGGGCADGATILPVPVQANFNDASAPDLYGDVVLANPLGSSQPMAMVQYFSGLSLASTYAFEVDAQLPSGISSSKIYLAVYNTATNALVGSDLCTLTSAWQTCTTGSFSLTAMTTYAAQVEFNQNGATGSATNQALLSRLRVRPLTGSSTILTSAFVRYQIDGQLLWDNVKDNPILYQSGLFAIFRERNPFSKFVFKTNAPTIGIQTFNEYTPATGQANIAVFVNHRLWTTIQPGYTYFDYQEVTLPTTGGLNLVEVFEGQDDAGLGEDSVALSVIAPQSYVFDVVPPPLTGERWLWYGDSKCGGATTTVPAQVGMIPLMRRQIPGSIIDECLPGRALWPDAQPGHFQGLVARLTQWSPTAIVLHIGFNDWSLTYWSSVGAFGNGFAQLVDLVHNARPQAKVWVFTDSLNTSAVEADTNGNSETVSQYRTAESTVCNDPSRATYCTTLNGAAIPNYNPATMTAADGVHPTDQGSAVIADWLVGQFTALTQEPYWGSWGAPNGMDYQFNANFGMPYLASNTIEGAVVNLAGAENNVESGLSLNFLTTSETVSTNGRLNFINDASQVWVGYHYSGSDYPLISGDGSGDVVFGTTGSSLETTLKGGAVVISTNFGNSLELYSGGAIASGFSAWKQESSPTFFDSASNVTIGGTTPDFGGMAGGMSFAPVSTASTAAPATNDAVEYLPVGLASVSPAATSTNLAGFGIAPVWAGTIESQTSLPHQVHGGWAETTTTAVVAAYTMSLGAGHAVGIHASCVGRVTSATTGNSLGDFIFWDFRSGFTNVSGTLAQGTPVTSATGSSSLTSATQVTATNSGPTISINVAFPVSVGGAEPTIDWTCTDYSVFD